MGRRKRACIGPVTVACAVALAGCSGAESTRPTAPASGPAGPRTPADERPDPAGTNTVDADPAKLPRTPAQARALIRKVIAEPALFGPRTVKGTPYEGDPDRWPVLGEDCVWRQKPLPEDVLATLTRHFEVPGGRGKGTARLTAVVTVHRTPEKADWENAGMLEEMLRCPEQQLGAGERITGLTSSAAYRGDLQNTYADDVLSERGDYHRRGDATAPYSWTETVWDGFTVSVSVKAARGYSRQEAQELDRKAGILMLHRLEQAIGHTVGDEPAAVDSPQGGGA